MLSFKTASRPQVKVIEILPPAMAKKEPEIRVLPGQRFLLRNYMWPRNVSLRNDPVPQKEALRAAWKIDFNLASLSPGSIKNALDQDAFAFQVVQVLPQLTMIGKIRRIFGSRAAGDHRQIVRPELYLVGEYDTCRKGNLMLRTHVGNFVQPERSAVLLGRDHLHPVCSYHDARDYLAKGLG